MGAKSAIAGNSPQGLPQGRRDSQGSLPKTVPSTYLADKATEL
jgi:hypothetical protein